MSKVVCFAGHRYAWNNVGVENKLRETIEDLINKGYTTFYDGGKGYFDELSAKIVFEMKHKYPDVKIIKVLTYYHHEKEKWEISSSYDGSVYPEIEEYHPKQKIIKRNEWIVDNSDILVCHVYDTYKSGAYRTLKYAQKINKPIIYI